MYTKENQSVFSHFTTAAAADNQSSLADLMRVALTFAYCFMRHDSAGVTTSTVKALQQRNIDAHLRHKLLPSYSTFALLLLSTNEI